MITSLFTPWRIILVTIGAVLAYCLFTGVERFLCESTGTLILSPSIYVRLLPPPFNRWLLILLNKQIVFCHLITLIPIAILMTATALAAFSVRRKSVWMAVSASAMVFTVFGVYHCLQPMGMTLVLY